MRILHVLRTLDPAWGGPIEGARNLTGRALAKGYTVEIVCLDDPGSPWLASWRPKVHPLGCGRAVYGFNRELDGWLSTNLVRFDAVVVHGIWMYLSYAVWRATRIVPVPYFLFIHGALDPWFRKQYPLKHLKKVAYWKLFEHRAMRDAQAVLFTTEEERRLAQDAFFPYECKPAVIGYGIVRPNPNESFNKQLMIRKLTANNPSLRHRDFFLFLARIHEKKGIDLLLKALAACKAARTSFSTVIAGPGSDETITSLKNLARSLGVAEDVVWVGPVYGEAKYDIIRAAEAYILPSHQENFGISVVEALSCGTPVLISNKVNIWREIESAGAGLVESDDVEGTVRLLNRWATLPLQHRSEMRMNAAQCFSANFDIAVTCDRFFDVVLPKSTQKTVGLPA
jgi:glycosyltransferase involved in cell wall biosynthesis